LRQPNAARTRCADRATLPSATVSTTSIPTARLSRTIQAAEASPCAKNRCHSCSPSVRPCSIRRISPRSGALFHTAALRSGVVAMHTTRLAGIICANTDACQSPPSTSMRSPGGRSARSSTKRASTSASIARVTCSNLSVDMPSIQPNGSATLNHALIAGWRSRFSRAP